MILKQENRSQMVSKPALLTTSKIGEENLEARIQISNIIGSKDNLFSTGSSSVTLTNKNFTTREGKADNLSIILETRYSQAWKSYLEDEESDLVGDNIVAVLETEDISPNRTRFTLTINGVAGHSSERNDISYFSEYQEIETKIS